MLIDRGDLATFSSRPAGLILRELLVSSLLLDHVSPRRPELGHVLAKFPLLPLPKAPHWKLPVLSVWSSWTRQLWWSRLYDRGLLVAGREIGRIANSLLDHGHDAGGLQLGPDAGDLRVGVLVDLVDDLHHQMHVLQIAGLLAHELLLARRLAN